MEAPDGEAGRNGGTGGGGRESGRMGEEWRPGGMEATGRMGSIGRAGHRHCGLRLSFIAGCGVDTVEESARPQT